MVFKRLLGSIGIGGPTVDTALSPGPVRPGSTLTGEVRLKGGDGDVTVDVTLELLARVEVEADGGEAHGDVAFDRYAVSEDLRLPGGEALTVPFSLTLPWETPVTELYGQPLGIVLGVRTEVAVAGSRDKGDLDPLTVRPLPAQEAVLEAFGQLGFGFVSADLEYGRIGGTSQALPFYQEIEISPAPRYAHVLKEVEVTFLAAPYGMDVVLEADRRGHHHGGDALNRFPVSYEDVDRTDWNTVVGGWIEQLVHAHAPYPGSGASTHPGSHHQDHGHHPDHGHRSGPGTGAVVAAGAAGLAVGVAGGLVAAEVVDEVGDFFENDEGDEGD
ncbi:sporulation protein [Streptomyces sp. NPDC005955]|uniref:sporulation protein n=1 Tax=Streptomyces sp. NPDC005955 TaxID=3364738 RepID=UPI00367413BF